MMLNNKILTIFGKIIIYANSQDVHKHQIIKPK